MMQHLAYMTIQYLVLLIPTNTEKNLVIRKVNDLVYLSEVLKAPLKVILLSLMYTMINIVK